MAYNPHTSSLHITSQGDRTREEVFVRPGKTPAELPEIVIPHRGITIRVIQGAMAEYHRKNPDTRPLFALILDGVKIGMLSIKV